MSQQPYVPHPHLEPPPPDPEVPRPASIVRAATLMFVQAVLSLIGLAVTLATVPSLRADVASRTTGLSASTLNATVEITVVAAVFFSLVSIALWVLLAVELRGGRKWAWIATLILTILGLLSQPVSLLRVGVGLSKGLGGLAGLLDILLLVLILAGSSREYVNRRR